jgi:putative redox protein
LRESPDAACGKAALNGGMSLTASAHTVPGSLRQEVLVSGRFLLETDEPAALGGDDTAPSPHELLPAALAACASTTIAMYARTKGWQIGEIAVDVDYDHKAVPRRCETTVRIGGPLTEAQLERLLKVAASCPVRRAIEGGIVFGERIERLADVRLGETASA